MNRITSTNKTVTSIAGILIFVSSLTVMILSIIANNKAGFNSGALIDIKTNWRSFPVMNIIDAKGNCAPEDTLAFGEWEGTTDGCDCSHSYNRPAGRYSNTNSRYVEPLTRGRCSRNETMAGCDTVRSFQPVPFRTWRGTSICTVRSHQTFYDLAQNVASVTEQCKNGFKQCGLLDTEGNKLCLSKTETCPVNKVLILPEGNSNKPTDYEYNSISLRQGYTLFFTNEAINEPIVINTRLSNGQICVNPLEVNKPISYILSRYHYAQTRCNDYLENGQVFDNRFFKLDSYGTFNLYDENGILPLVHQLPMYPPNLLQGMYELYFRPYLSWKPICLRDPTYNPNIIIELDNDLQTASGKQLVIMILAIIAFIFSLIAICVSCNVEEGNEVCSLVIEGIYCLFCIIIATLCYIAMSGINNVRRYSKDIALNQCGDEITDKIFQIISENSSGSHNNIIFILSIISFAVFPLMILLNIGMNKGDSQVGPLLNDEEAKNDN